jgi:hypothetical protein
VLQDVARYLIHLLTCIPLQDRRHDRLGCIEQDRARFREVGAGHNDENNKQEQSSHTCGLFICARIRADQTK